MNIEKAIKQAKPFRTEFLRAHINIIFTASWLQNRVHQILKPFGITPQQFNLLRILKGSSPNPCSVKDLIERMLDKTSNASRLVDKLLEKKLVERKVCPNDRRQVEIFITHEGLLMLEEASLELEKSIEATFRNLSNADAELLNDLLDKVRS